MCWRDSTALWPDGPQRRQMHLDIAVKDVDAATDAAVVLGAKPAEHQPAPEPWRVLLDPAGHPFSLTAVRPD
ncbi:hypothetical protein LJ752_01625 [Arthrobacter sp. zg-Y786]|uniref:Glyoxalase-like domain-containing protein n=2 Tax=Arthrobacter gengyunqii TaxID=2886940 RepID=A0ABS8GDQ2_9MICC|nr:VOC family protein [Arthrobacter gengyunqii]MCC3264745.1 hypothetical protein [Arthrobacter gengyunqii]